MNRELWSFSPGVGGADLHGMSVEALDGSVGRVQKVVAELGDACLVVDTGRWVFGKTTVLPAGVVKAVDHERRCVFIGCSKDEFENAPQLDPGAGDRGAREALGAYYGEVRRRHDREPASSTEPVSETVSSAASTRRHPFGGIGTEPRGPVSPAGARMPDEIDAPSPPSDAIAPTEPKQRQADTTPGSGPTPSPLRSDSAAGTGRDEEPAQGAPATSPTRRFTRDSGDGTSRAKGTSPSGGREHGNEGARTSTGQPPIARYDSLTAAEVMARLRNLSQRELATLERYEQRNDGRQTILSRIDSLREDEPWRGYDDATVPEIRRTLADADEDRVKAVRDYERRHRERKGVMEAARRILAAA